MVMFADTDNHLTRLSPVILNIESTGLTHLESEIRVVQEWNVIENWFQYSMSFKGEACGALDVTEPPTDVCGTVEPRSMDTRLIGTPVYHGRFRLPR